MNEPSKIEIPGGMVVLTTYGVVTAETVASLLEIRGHNHSIGMHNVHYAVVVGQLVDKARNEAMQQFLANPSLQYCIMLDADMQMPASTIQQLTMTAYHATPWADIVGGYCQLRGAPFLPTIDTGTGTWESTDVGNGPVEVIRTGGACLLVKRHVLERMPYPWFGVRPAPRPLEMLAELDNFARCKMDGLNPLREHPAWMRLEKCAQEDATSQRLNPESQRPGGLISTVGEDSNFTDKAKALGFRIVVDTNLVCGHVDRKVILPADHQQAIRDGRRLHRTAFGIMAA